MILYYTGTGNSRYAAKLLGHRLNDTVRDCTPFIQGGTTPRFHSVTPWVFVCPTYAWQIPPYFCGFSDPMPFFRQQAGILCDDLRR